jgi:hypothetical protein
MSSKQMPAAQAQLSPDIFGSFGPAMDYMMDAAQRTVLFWEAPAGLGSREKLSS